MLHFMFASSAARSPETAGYPSMYTDLGIPQLVKSCIELGARQNELSARLAGGAIMLGKGVAQSIRDGNILEARNILSNMGIKVIAENTGGNHMRAVRLDIATGKAYLKRPDSNWKESP